MGQYGFLLCMECQECIWLGKALFNQDRKPLYFHIGDENQPRNSIRPQLNKVIWKFFADHTDHTLRVVNERSPEFDNIDLYVEIGGDEIRDITFDDYLSGWPG